MIIVTGATGALGSRIVDHLLARVAPDRIGVSVRTPERAADLEARGVRVRRGDFTDPASLDEAFEGATQVLIVSADQIGEAATSRHATAIQAAHDAGAQRILYTSHQAAAADSLFAPMPDHATTELLLGKSGTPFTSLRNGFYATTITRLLGPALQTGELVAPADGPVSWTTHNDLAEAAAVLLTNDNDEHGPTRPLTAPDALDLNDVTSLLSELTGRTIRRVVAEDEDWTTTMTAHGMPAPQAAMLLGMFQAARNGEFAATDPLLESLLARPAESVRDYLATTL